MSAYPHPVVFLPGIMGSALRDEYPVAPETVWSAVKMMLNAYDRITLHPDDLRYEVQEPARVVKDQLFGLIYSEFIEELPNMNLVQRLTTCHLKGAIYGDVWGRRPPDLPAGTTWDPPIAGLTEKT